MPNVNQFQEDINMYLLQFYLLPIFSKQLLLFCL